MKLTTLIAASTYTWLGSVNLDPLPKGCVGGLRTRTSFHQRQLGTGTDNQRTKSSATSYMPVFLLLLQTSSNTHHTTSPNPPNPPNPTPTPNMKLTTLFLASLCAVLSAVSPQAAIRAQVANKDTTRHGTRGPGITHTALTQTVKGLHLIRARCPARTQMS
jgi:hypothetical protein